MLDNKRPVGGMMLAAVLLMGLLSRTGFADASGRVTVNDEILHDKQHCRLFIDGQEAELLPGSYDNALLLVEEHFVHGEQQTKLGKVSAADKSYYSLYVDA